MKLDVGGTVDEDAIVKIDASALPKIQHFNLILRIHNGKRQAVHVQPYHSTWKEKEVVSLVEVLYPDQKYLVFMNRDTLDLRAENVNSMEIIQLD